MRILENKYLSIDYLTEKAYFKVTRLSPELIDEYEYKKLMLDWLIQIEIFRPKIQLVNYQNFYTPIPPAMQTWISENLVKPAFEAGMQKVAFIISRDLYVQISLEQTMREETGIKLSIKYFDNELDAENWLTDNLN